MFGVIRTRHPKLRDGLVSWGGRFEVVAGIHSYKSLKPTKVLLCDGDWTVLSTVLGSRLHRHFAKPELGS